MFQFRNVNFLMESLYRRALASLPVAQEACGNPALPWTHPGSLWLSDRPDGQRVLLDGEGGRRWRKHLRTTTDPCWAPPVSVLLVPAQPFFPQD